MFRSFWPVLLMVGVLMPASEAWARHRRFHSGRSAGHFLTHRGFHPGVRSHFVRPPAHFRFHFSVKPRHHFVPHGRFVSPWVYRYRYVQPYNYRGHYYYHYKQPHYSIRPYPY